MRGPKSQTIRRADYREHRTFRNVDEVQPRIHHGPERPSPLPLSPPILPTSPLVTKTETQQFIPGSGGTVF